MRFWLAMITGLCLSSAAQAQDIPGFPREDFGKVVLSAKQLAGTDNLESAIGDYNNEPVSKYGVGSPFAQLGRPVGRLDVLTNTRMFPCTGFLISPKHVMTNHHCVPGLLRIPEVKQAGAKRIIAVKLVLGYLQEGVTEPVRMYTVSPNPVEASEALDYAILEVTGGPARTFGTVKLAARRIRDNYPHWVIGHPLGEAQKISREGCMSASPAHSSSRLRHRCDTLPGNSGSPVFDAFTQEAVALHHSGSHRNSINYAVPFSEILKQSKLLPRLLKRPAIQKRFASRDEARDAWQAIKDLSSPGLFETYIKRYPKFFYAEFARARLEELRNQLALANPSGDSKVSPGAERRQGSLAVSQDPKELAKILQRELKRIGCYTSSIDGDWGARSQQALEQFNKHYKAALRTDAPTPQAASTIRDISGRVCPKSRAVRTKSKRRTSSGTKSNRSRSSYQSGCVPYSQCVSICQRKGKISNCGRRCRSGVPTPRGPVCGY